MFVKNNTPFTCISCGNFVDVHPSSSRDHCKFCLHGLHVDIDPGDRANTCIGLLEPIGLRMHKGKQQIVFRCRNCGERVYNVIAPDDNFEVIHGLSTIPVR